MNTGAWSTYVRNDKGYRVELCVESGKTEQETTHCKIVQFACHFFGLINDRKVHLDALVDGMIRPKFTYSGSYSLVRANAIDRRRRADAAENMFNVTF